jgi:biopolymer transport protein ExbD
MRFLRKHADEKLAMNMTPMIDVCFQLIIFFMLSLRLFSAEGDFNIKMPLAAPKEGPPDNVQTPPLKVRLRSDAKGNLTGIIMGRRKITGFKDLQNHIRDVARLDRGPAGGAGGLEVEIDCDYNLRYEYVVKVLTSVTAYVSDDRHTIVRLAEKIRFSPPRKPIE